MLYFRHQTLLIISGIIWLGVGCYLLPLGLSLILANVYQNLAASNYFLLGSAARYAGGSENGAIILIAVSLFIGFIKGRYVLAKSVNRVATRLSRFPNPTHLLNIYSFSYYLLLGSMVLLGVSIKYFHVPDDIRGAVDVAIGTALINGSLLFFRRSQKLRTYP